MQALDALHDVAVELSDRIDHVVGVGLQAVLGQYDRVGKEFELPRIPVQLFQEVREVVAELLALDPLEPVGFAFQMLRDARTETPVVLTPLRRLEVTAVSRNVARDRKSVV